MRYWLMKSEPDVFSIDDLAACDKTPWEGVRNYQARNSMRDDMRPGDRVLYYHSNAKPSGVAGVAEIASDEAIPDFTAWDPKHKYHDPKSTPEHPRWWMVELRFVEKFPQVIPLAALKADPALEGMPLLARGQRLSVMPVDPDHFAHILSLGRA